MDLLTNLVSLTSLSLDHCGFLYDLAPLSALTRLQHLDVSQCPCKGLQPIALPSLVRLDASDCSGAFLLAPLRNCSKLRLLDVSGSWKVKGFQHFSSLTSLQLVMASHCSGLDSFHCFSGSLPSLFALDASNTYVADIQLCLSSGMLPAELASQLAPCLLVDDLDTLGAGGWLQRRLRWYRCWQGD